MQVSSADFLAVLVKQCISNVWYNVHVLASQFLFSFIVNTVTVMMMMMMMMM